MSPLLAMRDLTKVSGKKEMGKALTLSVARGVEVRPIALALLLPAAFLGAGKDKQARAKKMARALESRGMEGKAFFAGSLLPADLEEARVFYP